MCKCVMDAVKNAALSAAVTSSIYIVIAPITRSFSFIELAKAGSYAAGFTLCYHVEECYCRMIEEECMEMRLQAMEAANHDNYYEI